MTADESQGRPKRKRVSSFFTILWKDKGPHRRQFESKRYEGQERIDQGWRMLWEPGPGDVGFVLDRIPELEEFAIELAFSKPSASALGWIVLNNHKRRDEAIRCLLASERIHWRWLLLVMIHAPDFREEAAVRFAKCKIRPKVLRRLRGKFPWIFPRAARKTR